MLRNQSIDIESCLIDPIFVPESMPILRVMELFKGPRINLALVIDEFGGLQGLVTINDILEAIVGEIGEWGEPSEPEIVYREDGTLLIDGMLPIDELKELLHVDVLPREEQTNYQTLSGFIMAYLGKIPAISEHFEWGGYRFEIIDMDGFRVDKVLVDPGEQK
jgi:putative hemolysin